MPDVLVQEVKAADVKQIAAIEKGCFASPWREEFFISELTATGRHNRVARSTAGELIGYVFSMYFMDEMHVNKIAVAERCRRQGVAGALMEECLEFASISSIAMVSLEVRESNRAAQSFYLTLGFEAAYRRPRYYPDGEAAIVMSKRVT